MCVIHIQTYLHTHIQSHTYTHTYTVIQAHIHTHTHTYPHTYKRIYMFETSASFSCQGMSFFDFLASPWMLKEGTSNPPPLSRFFIERFQFEEKNGLCRGWKDNDNCGGEDWWCKFRYLVDGCLSKLMRLRMDVGPCLLIKMISGPGNLPTGLTVKRPVLQVHQNPTKSLWEVEIVCFIRNISHDSFFQNGISNPILSMARNVLCSFLVLLALRRNEEHPKTCYKKNHRILVVYKQDNTKNTSGVTQQFTSGRQVLRPTMNHFTKIVVTMSPVVMLHNGKPWTAGGRSMAGLCANCLNPRKLGWSAIWVKFLVRDMVPGTCCFEKKSPESCLGLQDSGLGIWRNSRETAVWVIHQLMFIFVP